MTYDEIKDRLWKVSRELQQVVDGMPKADDRPPGLPLVSLQTLQTRVKKGL